MDLFCLIPQLTNGNLSKSSPSLILIFSLLIRSSKALLFLFTFGIVLISTKLDAGEESSSLLFKTVAVVFDLGWSL